MRWQTNKLKCVEKPKRPHSSKGEGPDRQHGRAVLGPGAGGIMAAERDELCTGRAGMWPRAWCQESSALPTTQARGREGRPPWDTGHRGRQMGELNSLEGNSSRCASGQESVDATPSRTPSSLRAVPQTSHRRERLRLPFVPRTRQGHAPWGQHSLKYCSSEALHVLRGRVCVCSDGA